MPHNKTTIYVTDEIRAAFEAYRNQVIDTDTLGRPLTRDMFGGESTLTFAAGYQAAQAQASSQAPVGWVYGNSYWEATNPRLPPDVSKLGSARYAQPVALESIPLESSEEAAKAIQEMLKKYDYPSNPTNAARAGWRAARLYSAKEQPEPQAPSLVCPTCKADRFKEDCKGVRSQCPVTAVAQPAQESRTLTLEGVTAVHLEKGGCVLQPTKLEIPLVAAQDTSPKEYLNTWHEDFCPSLTKEQALDAWNAAQPVSA